MHTKERFLDHLLHLVSQRPLTTQETTFYHPLPKGLSISDIAQEILERIKLETPFSEAHLVENSCPNMLEIQLV